MEQWHKSALWKLSQWNVYLQGELLKVIHTGDLKDFSAKAVQSIIQVLAFLQINM